MEILQPLLMFMLMLLIAEPVGAAVAVLVAIVEDDIDMAEADISMLVGSPVALASPAVARMAICDICCQEGIL